MYRPQSNYPRFDGNYRIRLSDGGPDHPANVIALCPNCHRRAHHALDSDGRCCPNRCSLNGTN
ncbi:HNH endonuclease [Aeromonas enteropelogenes]|uniref:HNH endonuclease n=1 Tax=Aeromonas enteropelogenes TaxID=29489 RepID=UPI003B9DD91C